MVCVFHSAHIQRHADRLNDALICARYMPEIGRERGAVLITSQFLVLSVKTYSIRVLLILYKVFLVFRRFSSIFLLKYQSP
jgi:hypothetical protein